MHFSRLNRARVAQRPELGKQNVCIFYGEIVLALLNAQSMESRMYAFLRLNRARVAQRPELGKQNVCIFTVKSCWRCFLGPFCGLGLEML